MGWGCKVVGVLEAHYDDMGKVGRRNVHRVREGKTASLGTKARRIEEKGRRKEGDTNVTLGRQRRGRCVCYVGSVGAGVLFSLWVWGRGAEEEAAA